MKPDYTDYLEAKKRSEGIDVEESGASGAVKMILKRQRQRKIL